MARVSLQPLVPEHAEVMYQWICDPSVRDNIGLRRTASLDATKRWITNAAKDETICAFAIYASDVYVGNAVLDNIDIYLKSARLSIYIGERSVRGQGVGSTAIHLLLSKAFKQYDLQKVWLIVHERNINAIRAYYHAGFSLEGIHRREFFFQGQYINTLYMGILESEFAKNKSENDL